MAVQYLCNKDKIESLKHQVKLIENEIKELEQSNEVVKPSWIPDDNSTYFYLTDDEVSFERWHGTNWQWNRLSVGNVFKTSVDATNELNRMETFERLKRFSRPFVKGEDNVSIGFSVEENKLAYVSARMVMYSELYFESQEKAEIAVHYAGEDNVKNFYLGVE